MVAAAASDLREWRVAAAAANGGCATWRRWPPAVVRRKRSGSCRHSRRMRMVRLAVTAGNRVHRTCSCSTRTPVHAVAARGNVAARTTARKTGWDAPWFLGQV